MSINYVGRVSVSVTRHFFAMLLLSLISFGSYATENTIQISQENLDTLGVKLGKPGTRYTISGVIRSG
jgi:hypothetical protein